MCVSSVAVGVHQFNILFPCLAWRKRSCGPGYINAGPFAGYLDAFHVSHRAIQHREDSGFRPPFSSVYR